MNTDRTPEPIVVGVDGSRFGIEALRWALEEGRRRDCAVRALLVAHASPVQELMETIRAVLGDHDDPRLSAEVVHGAPGEALCAASAQAQLLVLGSHGHGPLVGTVAGSVARYCVRHAACPVVIIPATLAPAPIPAVVPSQVVRPEPVGYGPGPLL